MPLKSSNSNSFSSIKKEDDASSNTILFFSPYQNTLFHLNETMKQNCFGV